MLIEHPSKRMIIATAAAASILAFSGVGATWAFMSSAHEGVQNAFTISDCKASIVEEFTPPDSVEPGDEITKEVRVRNDGNTSCYVRTLVQFEDGSCEEWACIEFNEDDWALEEDGYRYYGEVLEPGELSPPVCTKVTIDPEAEQTQIESFNVIALCESTPTKSRDGSIYECAQDAFEGRKDQE